MFARDGLVVTWLLQVSVYSQNDKLWDWRLLAFTWDEFVDDAFEYTTGLFEPRI